MVHTLLLFAMLFQGSAQTALEAGDRQRPRRGVGCARPHGRAAA